MVIWNSSAPTLISQQPSQKLSQKSSERRKIQYQLKKKMQKLIVDRTSKLKARTTTEFLNSKKCNQQSLPLNPHTGIKKIITSYNFKDAFEKLTKTVDNTKNQATTWFCNENCKTLDPDILQILADLFKTIIDVSYSNSFEFYRDIDICSCESRDPNKMGHPKDCYEKPLSCKSMFLKLSYLSAHYPWLRTIKRLIYKIKAYYQSISQIENALNTNDIVELKNIAKSFNILRTKFHCPDDVICLDEVKIKNKYETGIIEFQKIDRDPPSIPCISCERLCCFRDMSSLQKCADDLKVIVNSYNLRERKPVEYVDDVGDDVEDEKENAKDPSFKPPSKETWNKFLQLYDAIELQKQF